MRYQAGVLTASYFPLKVPNAPTIGTASVASGTSASVTFTAPSDIGGGAITSYIVASSEGQTASSSTSPITVTGLTTGVSYTFRAFAINAFGSSPASAASNSVTPVSIGQEAFITAGSYSWIAPAGVTSVSLVAVGGGGIGNDDTSNRKGGGGGGGLGYKNNISVTPGSSYTVVVGAAGLVSANGGSSSFNGVTYATGGVSPGGSTTGGAGGTSVNSDGGGSGGNGGNGDNGGAGGGGAGAGGYSGNGGAGGNANNAGTAGSGGGGGGGYYEKNGGGVGLLGQGANGAAGAPNQAGQGGSGGTNGTTGGAPTVGRYGGGGAVFQSIGGPNGGNGGAQGAVRIIWPGTTRSFPSTNTGDL